jgi:two-component system sensor histidine kinase BaeS
LRTRSISLRGRIYLALGISIAITTAALVALATDLLVIRLSSATGQSSAASTGFPWDVAGLLAVGAALAFWPAMAVGLVVMRPAWQSLRGLTRRVEDLADGRDGDAFDGWALPPELASLAAALDRVAAREVEREVLRQRFAADAAHELRTPVTGLRAYLEAMRDGALPADGEYLNRTLTELSRMERLIGDLDRLVSLNGGMRPPSMTSYDYGEQLREVLAVYGPLLSQRRLSLETRLASEGLMVLADRDRVAEALHNLLSNASRYARAGGLVRIAVDRTPGWVRTRLYNDVDAPVERPARLLERFYRGEGSRARTTGGSGLGLAITRQLLEGMGATIRVRAAGRRGIEVDLRLRSAPDTASPDAPPDVPG